MNRIIAIGDIHGCAKTFHKLIEDEIKIRKSDTIYCIGDYIDRGPDSKGVVDLILDLRKKGYQLRTLRGNHEQLMLDSVNGGQAQKDWYINGGDTTLKSFGATSFRDFDPVYQDFFKRTRLYFENGPYIFVHAGLNFGPEDIFEDTEAMMCIRDFKVDPEKLGTRIIVHGHTPRPLQMILKQKENVFNLDAGCVYTERHGHGYLVALNLTNKEWF
ncbi:MAG TPA: metallophosphoesterase, partial [Saprospiraceae bacterium]